ncbi:MAG TPA: hypothetical protein PKD50_15100, partial [Leptospiraceae bacterium]|nr:hypothetical protein [Leptospiraceae bacterium]
TLFLISQQTDYANFSFGWRWDFDFGLLFGFDLGIAKELNPHRNFYVFSDEPGLIDKSRIPSLRDLAYYQMVSYPTGIHQSFLSFNIFSGISF